MLKNFAVAAAAGFLAVGSFAACSSGSSEPAASPTDAAASPSPSSSEESVVALDKEIQTDLNAVGCYAGAVDGILGPQTDQAIVAFQSADGLTVDGEAGPSTIAALKLAAREGRIVCTATSSASPSTSPSTSASPTVTPVGAPCTAAALQASLPSGSRLQSFVCVHVAAERWAAGQFTSGPDVQNFFAKASNGTWDSVSRDEVCGTASAGLPEKILDYCGTT